MPRVFCWCNTLFAANGSFAKTGAGPQFLYLCRP